LQLLISIVSFIVQDPFVQLSCNPQWVLRDCCNISRV